MLDRCLFATAAAAMLRSAHGSGWKAASKQRLWVSRCFPTAEVVAVIGNISLGGQQSVKGKIWTNIHFCVCPQRLSFTLRICSIFYRFSVSMLCAALSLVHTTAAVAIDRYPGAAVVSRDRNKGASGEGSALFTLSATLS